MLHEINKSYFVFGLTIGLFIFYLTKNNPYVVYVLPEKDKKFIDNKNRCYKYLKKKV
tara:strand:- start:107 stop:277 length:171 start_codon:yes stop_codon:yes gene_type:complete